jgi:transcription antitermination factor NusG
MWASRSRRYNEFAVPRLGTGLCKAQEPANVSHRAKLCAKAFVNEMEPKDQVGSAWYALYTKFQHEKKAADFLAKKDFEVLLPLYQAVHQWKDRKKQVLLPVFPCYVFVRTELSRKLELLRTPGVFSIVSSAGRASAVPDNDVDFVQRISSVPDSIAPHPYLAGGEFVRVRVGPFAGLMGIVARVKNQFRVVMSVEFLKKSVAVELDAASVELCRNSGEASEFASEKRSVA